eukprot:TRINITY_DN58385_c0_g1_i1.p1 TRINITY_DN58385_c0_g1~~TRINITY_DN58385_c0_g1_i1.p1  ORF type:complete len:424 (-),score=30.34 TRINITY_DN58385_c0_g1_i1:62-1333(-)
MAAANEVVPDPVFDLRLEPLPSTYEFVSDGIHLESHATRKLQQLIERSLPGARIVSLRRFANRSLWEAYQVSRRRVEADNAGDANAQLLFHGTRDPSAILGTGLASNCDGFDFRRSSGGSYGTGAYFAREAAYPIKIFPRNNDPIGHTFQLIIAEVALGDVYDFGDRCDASLSMPPDKRERLTYNSVCGTEGGIGLRWSTQAWHGKQFVVYDRFQAYPHFLAVVEPDPLRSLMRVRIVFDEPEGGDERLRQFNRWRLCHHAHEPSHDRRNDHSWRVCVHHPSFDGGSIWQLRDGGHGRYRIEFAEPGGHANNGWQLSCHAWDWDGVQDARNDVSWWTILHADNPLGFTWRIEATDQGRYHIIFDESEGGDARLQRYNGWRLACHAWEPCGDKRNDSSWFVCLHDLGDDGAFHNGSSWRLDVVA